MLTRVLTLVEELDDLDRTMASLDHQTAPTGSFEVRVLMSDPDPAAAVRMAALTAGRPYVNLLTAGDLTRAEALAALVAQDGADRILVLPPGAQLLPDALARLAELGEQVGADAVEGSATGRGPRVVLAERSVAAAAASALTSAPDETMVEQWRQEVASRAAHRVSLSDHAAVQGLVDRQRSLPRERCRASWDGTTLTIEVMLADEEVPQDTRLLLREIGSGAEQSVPARIPPGSPRRVTARLELAREADPPDVPDGSWEVRLGTWPESIALPRMPLGPAVVDGRPVAPSRGNANLVLQVGWLRRNPVQASVEDVTVEETHRGTLLAVRLPHLHLAGEEPFRGHVTIGDLEVPALIRSRDAGPQLEVWLTGLPGTYDLSAAFGTRRSRPLGLALVIDTAGQMHVRPAERQREHEGASHGDTSASGVRDRGGHGRWRGWRDATRRVGHVLRQRGW